MRLGIRQGLLSHCSKSITIFSTNVIFIKNVGVWDYIKMPFIFALHMSINDCVQGFVNFPRFALAQSRLKHLYVVLNFSLLVIGLLAFHQSFGTTNLITLKQEVNLLNATPHHQLSVLPSTHNFPSLPLLFEVISEDDKNEDTNEDEHKDEVIFFNGFYNQSTNSVCKIQLGYWHSNNFADACRTLPLFILHHSWKSFIA